MQQAERQPVRRRRLWRFRMGVEGWLKQRVSDGRDFLLCNSSFVEVYFFLISGRNHSDINAYTCSLMNP
jgi:hypothetical protein